jgi:uncharacterized protein
MSRKIAIEIGQQRFEAQLLETPTADAIWAALPLEVSFSTWGDEIYFDTGVTVDPDDTQPTVAMGDLGYWPPGRAMCLFYGPTPASGPGEIRPASPVAVFGRLETDPRLLKSARGRQVRVSRAA